MKVRVFLYVLYWLGVQTCSYLAVDVHFNPKERSIFLSAVTSLLFVFCSFTRSCTINTMRFRYHSRVARDLPSEIIVAISSRHPSWSHTSNVTAGIDDVKYVCVGKDCGLPRPPRREGRVGLGVRRCPSPRWSSRVRLSLSSRVRIRLSVVVIRGSVSCSTQRATCSHDPRPSKNLPKKRF